MDKEKKRKRTRKKCFMVDVTMNDKETKNHNFNTGKK